MVTSHWTDIGPLTPKLPLDLVFYPVRRGVDSTWIVDSYRNNNYIGLPLLELTGLTISSEKATSIQIECFF